MLHLTKFSDHGLVLHTVDSEAGRRSFLLRGIKHGNAVAVFHPLGLLDVVSAESPKSSLAYLREWEPAAALHSVRSDRVKSSIALFLSEVLYRSLTSELADPGLFSWICAAVETLEGAEGSVANYPLWFLVCYAVKLGFMPGEPIEPSGIFDERDEALLRQLLKASFPEAMAIPLSSSRRLSLSRKLLQYLSWHLGANIDAHSLDVLHAVLA